VREIDRCAEKEDSLKKKFAQEKSDGVRIIKSILKRIVS